VTRVIVAAAGGQTKWGGYLGVPSHLAPIGGVPLLHRTLKQLGHLPDVHVTTPDDDRYQTATAQRHIRSADYPSEFHSTRNLWNRGGRTVLLYGDVYFTDDALDTIIGYEPRQVRVFGRYGPSAQTGCPYGEVFAASWWPEHHSDLERRLLLVDSARRAGVTRPVPWMLLRNYQGTPMSMHVVDPYWFGEIDDLTDDFDFPADYDRHPAARGG
jgi:hypothetical protein